jgi:hypothetical protein
MTRFTGAFRRYIRQLSNNGSPKKFLNFDLQISKVLFVDASVCGRRENSYKFSVKIRRKKMKTIVFVFVVAFAFCTMAMASDIAFYVGQWNTDGWYGPEQFEDVETIIAETGHLFEDIQQFDDDQLDEFGAWVDENTDDGEMDIIWLNGCMPSVLYPNPNRKPDGSRAEEWLDGGDMIINLGDLFAAVTFEGGYRRADNGPSGAANILDLSSGIFAFGGGTQMTVTPTGKEYLPSLNDPVVTRRPVVLVAVQDPWEVAAVFASSDGTDNGGQAEPVVIHNTETGGYLAIINQAARGHWIDDRGLTCAEFINNWVNTVIGLGDQPFARRPFPKNGAIYENTWMKLVWHPGDFAVSHDVYFGDNFDDVNDGAEGTFQGNLTDTFFFAGFPQFPYPDGLVPGTTYYWRVDEVNEEEPNSPWIGDVWNFMVPPRTAYNPEPADGTKFVVLDTSLSWTTGFGAKMHTVYFGDNFDDVNNATGGFLQETTTYDPGALENEKTYYWRVDEFDGAATHKGDIWSFTTLPEIPITDPNLVGWWKFDEGHGMTSVDWSGRDNHGILVGDPQWVDGQDGGALKFYRSSWVDYGYTPALQITEAITIACWVNPASLVGDRSFVALDAGYAFKSSSDHLRFTTPGIKDHDAMNATLEIGVWQHVAVTFQPNQTVVFYINGFEAERMAGSAANTGTGRFRIGNNQWTQFYFGLIDDVRIYNVALTAEEIVALVQ